MAVDFEKETILNLKISTIRANHGSLHANVICTPWRAGSVHAWSVVALAFLLVSAATVGWTTPAAHSELRQTTRQIHKCLLSVPDKSDLTAIDFHAAVHE